MSRIFVTGPTGFIGKRLVASLLEQGHIVYALCRIYGTKVGSLSHPNLHLIYGDLEFPETIQGVPIDLDVAYYLVHSMAKKLKNLLEKEEVVAQNFVEIVNKTRCQQIIYLGGIIQPNTLLSAHLLSRKNVEKVLKTARPSLTVLRASIIIGAGSASFEIIRDLAEKIPIMIAPRWVKSLCQPIAISDVIFYLIQVLLNPHVYNKTLDIGGPEQMPFEEVLQRYAKFRKLKRYIFKVPFLTLKLSSYWLVFTTSVRFSLCSYLVESMKYNSVCTNTEIQKIIPHQCKNLEESLELAFLKIAKNEVMSTWMDAWEIESKKGQIFKFTQAPLEGCLRDLQKTNLKYSRGLTIERLWKIGGETGWYGLDWLWRLRGLIDKVFFHGPGMNRRRRHPTELEVGDAIDFWRVLKAEKEDGYLLLYAEMNLPGEAWLEFKVQETELYQLAVFRPKGFLGRLYWYFLFPFHFLIFRKMIKGISGF